jgi:hypothetical protein
MANIYEQAGQVIIWLGCLSHIAPLLKAIKDGALLDRDCEEQEALLILARQLDMVEYWSRLWILQEALFTLDIVITCGTGQVRSETAAQLYQLIYDPRDKIDSLLRLVHPQLRLRPDDTKAFEVILEEMAQLAPEGPGSDTKFELPRQRVFQHVENLLHHIPIDGS